MTMPRTIHQGDSAYWAINETSYPSSDGWVLDVSIMSGINTHTIRAAPAANGYTVTLAPADTVSWVPGIHLVQHVFSRAGERRTFVMGDIWVGPGNASTGPTQAQAALDAVKSAYASYMASNGTISSYEIAGRKVSYRTSAEIIVAIRFWEREVAKEDYQRRILQGLPSGATVRVRF